MIKKLTIKILERLGVVNFIFYKASIKLKNYGWRSFFKRALRVISNKTKSEIKKPRISKEDIARLRDTQYVYPPKEYVDITIAFTIVSKNYMSYALTLRDSFLKHNSHCDFYIVLVDMFRNKDEARIFKDLALKGVKILAINEIRNGIPYFYLESMLFKYDILEMNTAIKPFFLEYFCNMGFKNILYIDPDIYFVNSIEPMIEKLSTYDAILTPHTLMPYPEKDHPDDLDIVRAGSYNLGFIAIRNTQNAINMCKWWQNKLYDLCVNDITKGLFVDQKWMDLAPSMFERVYIERSPAYNVAYWNLHERSVNKLNDEWLVNGKSLIFFHFSGLPINDIDCISKHQDRYSLNEFSQMKPLFEEYRNAVINHGHDVFKSVCSEYYYGYIPETNIRIPDTVRYDWYKEILQDVPNPYLAEIANINKLYKAVYEPLDDLPRFSRSIYKIRPDLQKYFGDITSNKSKIRYLSWFKTKVIREHYVPKNILNKGVITDSDINNNHFGVNLVAYFKSVSGTATTARKFFKELLPLGLPFSTTVLSINGAEQISADEGIVFDLYHTESSLYNKTIFFINADSIKGVAEYYPRLFKNTYIIAVWWWEFDDYFYFDESFQYVDEVIVMSDFIKKAVQKRIPDRVKLTKIAYPFSVDWQILDNKESIRKKYGIATNNFVLFFNFDYFSSFERKNPLGLLQAFSIFAKGKSDVKLILKTVNCNFDNDNAAKLSAYVNENGLRDKVIFVNEAISRDEMMTLLNSADCYASLHRSEGFGLGMLEAMYLNIPVIGTAYGGNLDFMNDNNSYLVPYTLVENPYDFGPYKKGWLWADPDISVAAAHMDYIYNNRQACVQKAKQAGNMIREQYNKQRIQQEIFEILT